MHKCKIQGHQDKIEMIFRNLKVGVLIKKEVLNKTISLIVKDLP
jgi:hypothetical protein